MEPFIGEIRMVGFNFAPRGWAFCDGSLLAISQYSALFSLLGATYGGDGRSTFALPDYRGRGPVGMGHGPGLTPVRQGEMAGIEDVTLSTAQLPQHAPDVKVEVAIPAVSASSNVEAAPSNSSILGPVAASGRPGTLYSTDDPDVTLKPFDATATVSPVGGGASVPVRNPFTGMNFIIALEGIFPSHS